MIDTAENSQFLYIARRSIGPTIVCVAFVALLSWTWRKLPDPLIDFGRELYVPWQLAEGTSLYRDIAYFNGPLSPTFNAAVVRLFGVSFSTLLWTNVVLAALLTVMLYRFLARGFGPPRRFGQLGATLGSLVFLTGFAFSHRLNDGNYSYICPYSHEMTHGILLSIAMLGVVCRDFRLRSAPMFLAGVLLGLVFLTKAEIFLAASCAAAAAVVAPPFLGRVAWCHAFRSWIALALGAILPVAGFAAWLSRQMPWEEALFGVAGSWPWIFTGRVTELYRPMAGLDQPLVSLQLMGKSVLATVLIFVALVLYDRFRHRRSSWLVAGIVLSILSVALLRGRGFPLLLEGGPLLIASLAMVAGFGWLAVRHKSPSRHKNPSCHKNDDAQFVRLAMLAVWATFALCLLAKIVLMPRTIHYGFVLAMPATLMAVGVLLDVLPKWLCRNWKGGAVFRLAIAGLVLADVLGFVLMSSANLRHKTSNIAAGPDRIVTYDDLTSPVGRAVTEFLAEAEATFPPDATFVALPEGIMLNYLSRRRNPMAYINVMPPEVCMVGEAKIVEALAADRPDYVVLVSKNMTEYGVGSFGCPEYGEPVMNWVRQHYHPIRTITVPNTPDDDFVIEILAPRTRPSAAKTAGTHAADDERAARDQISQKRPHAPT